MIASIEIAPRANDEPDPSRIRSTSGTFPPCQPLTLSGWPAGNRGIGPDRSGTARGLTLRRGEAAGAAESGRHRPLKTIGGRRPDALYARSHALRRDRQGGSKGCPRTDTEGLRGKSRHSRIRVRRTLVFVSKIWHLELGQHCCPNCGPLDAWRGEAVRLPGHDARSLGRPNMSGQALAPGSDERQGRP